MARRAFLCSSCRASPAEGNRRRRHHRADAHSPSHDPAGSLARCRRRGRQARGRGGAVVLPERSALQRSVRSALQLRHGGIRDEVGPDRARPRHRGLSRRRRDRLVRRRDGHEAQGTRARLARRRSRLGERPFKRRFPSRCRAPHPPVADHYRGQVYAWDVVNEAIADDGPGLRDSVFRQKLGDGYIADAFRLAHQVDPQALLFYNDYGGEDLNAKSDRIYDLVRGLVQQGVPIDGVGLQMHISASNPPDAAAVASNMRRFVSLGLRVNISEMDVQVRDLAPTTRLDVQKSVYHSIVGCMRCRIALRGRHVLGIHGRALVAQLARRQRRASPVRRASTRRSRRSTASRTPSHTADFSRPWVRSVRIPRRPDRWR